MRKLALALVLLLSACGSEFDDLAEDDLAEEIDDIGTPEAADANAGGVDLTLQRSDVDCSADGLGSSDETDFTVAHVVVGGSLGAVCFGDENPTLIEAWEALAVITPSLQLADLALFGGFDTPGGDEVTLAFVNVVDDDDGSAFQMSVNLEEYEYDGNEALLTMAHEFSHVFTGLSTQLDRSDEAFDSCDTYLASDGCYRADSLMYQWITQFWGGGLIDQIDPYEEASGADGQERCDLNPGFFGAYAASNPEEDFAESFSAMVFRLDAKSDAQQDKIDWLAAQPGLVEFQDRAIQAGIGPLDNNFDPCGSGS